MARKVQDMSIPLEYKARTGLFDSVTFDLPFIYFVKESSTLGTSQPPFRALLYFNGNCKLHQGWDLNELAKSVGKEFYDRKIGFDDLNVYNGTYAFSNLDSFDKGEDVNIKRKIKAVKRWYSRKLLQKYHRLDDML